MGTSIKSLDGIFEANEGFISSTSSGKMSIRNIYSGDVESWLFTFYNDTSSSSVFFNATDEVFKDADCILVQVE